MSKCTCNAGHSYSFDYTPAEDSGCETCGINGGSLRINRYCKECKAQAGFADIWDRTEFEFSTAEELYVKAGGEV